MTNARIYVIHHDKENYPLFDSDTIIPILAGNPVRDGYRIALRDTVGVISITDPEQQDIYSEFTALYYIWKNLAPSDPNSIVGFMHYRSFLDLRGGLSTTYPSLESRFGYDASTLRSSLSQGAPCVSLDGIPLAGTHGLDAIVSEPLTFQKGIYRQYDACHPMAATLFQKAKSLLEETQYPNAREFFDEHFSLGKYAGQGRQGFFKCLLLCSWRYFDAYCTFIFHILDNLYADEAVRNEMQRYQMIKGPDRPGTQKRTRFRLLAFFAERMTSFFIAYSIKNNRFRIGTAPRCHYESMKQLVQEVYPAFPNEKLRPVLRVYSIEKQDHMPVSDLNELNTMKDQGYFCEGPLGYIYTEQVPGSTPVYRVLFKSGKHCCTKDLHCVFNYKEYKILGYTRDFPTPSQYETLHLEEYVLVGQVDGYVTTTNPKEFPVTEYDPNRPDADKMADLGYLVDVWGREREARLL